MCDIQNQFENKRIRKAKRKSDKQKEDESIINIVQNNFKLKYIIKYFMLLYKVY
jgi:hypothetical protein